MKKRYKVLIHMKNGPLNNKHLKQHSLNMEVFSYWCSEVAPILAYKSASKLANLRNHLQPVTLIATCNNNRFNKKNLSPWTYLITSREITPGQ